jgi:hypothetical protein
MGTPRALVLAATVAALAAAPLTLAGAADASSSASSPAYSVSILHCGGGIAVKAYPSKAAATHARNQAVRYQKHHAAALHKVQLRHGSTVLATSTRAC